MHPCFGGHETCFARAVTERQIAVALRRGERVSDAAFDALLSNTARLGSRRFWTPVDVAQRAANWLERAGAERVLDVGSGVGKFCVVAALSTDITFVGVEQRATLVAEAAALAGRLEVSQRASFVHEELAESTTDGYDAAYAFNPFAENLFHCSERYDQDPSLDVHRYARVLRLFERVMARVRVGFRVVTYHGCGARIPDNFDLTRNEYAGTNMLRMWTKTRRRVRGAFWQERFVATDLCAPSGSRLLTVPRSESCSVDSWRMDGTRGRVGVGERAE